MARRLTTATCLAAAICAALGSASVAAMSPAPLSLIGALLPTQDDESDMDGGADESIDEAADEATFADAEDMAGDTEEAAVDAPADEEAAADLEPSEEPPQDEPEQASEPVSEEVAVPEEASEVPEPPPPPPEPPANPPAPVPAAREAQSGGDGGGREERADTTIYKVVINHEEQYSIWPADRENAPGWNDAGKSGTKQECLDYIQEVWSDMRPASLRKQMEDMERRRQSGGQ